jgi:hypothetical protein
MTSLKTTQLAEKNTRSKIEKYPGKLILDTYGRALYVDEHIKLEISFL